MDRANWKINCPDVRRVLGDAVESVVVGGLCYVALQKLIGPLRVSRIIQSRSLGIMDAIGVDTVASLVNH